MAVTTGQCRYPDRRLGDGELRLLADLAATHAVGAMEPLPVDRDRYPFQGAYRMDGQVLPVADIVALSTQLEPRFGQIRAGLDAPGQEEIVRSVGAILDDGHDVAIALPHGTLIDIGLAEAALYLALRERGHRFRTAILVSQTLQTLALRFGDLQVPTAEALGYMCDHVYFSNPRTKRVAESGFSDAVREDHLSAHNQTMVRDLRRELARGRLLLALAPSGTSDVSRGDVHTLAPLTSGTIRLMGSENLFVLPVAARILHHDPYVYVLAGEPVRVRSAADAHALMDSIAAALGTALPGQRFVYEAHRR